MLGRYMINPGAAFSGLFVFAAVTLIFTAESMPERVGTSPEIIIGDESGDSDEDRWDPDGYFTVGSDDGTVRKVMGEPDEKFFDGHQEEWYYGPDTVYFDMYWEVNGADNKDGKLKMR